MFLRSTIREKDGKQHHHWSVVESRGPPDWQVVSGHIRSLPDAADGPTPCRPEWKCQAIDGSSC